MTTIVVTRNYQITIPYDIREELGIEIGDKLVTKIKDNNVIIKKINKNTIENTFGIWKKDFSESSVDYVRKLRKSWER